MNEKQTASLYALLRDSVRDASAATDSVAVAAREGDATWQDLARWTEEAALQLERLARQRVGLITESSAGSIVALAALDRLHADTFLINPSLPADERGELAERFKLGALLEAGMADGRLWLRDRCLAGADPGSGESTVTILTSGTTGTPKAAQHTWASLFRPVRAAARAPIWMLTYPLRLYAGLQVLCQCVAERGTLVISPTGGSGDEIARLLADYRVQFASGTPSFWRRLVLLADPDVLARASLRQVTLGGEVVDQSVLDLLKRRFPSARLVHIYASTEHGRCFSVTDERAGFPRRFLDGPSSDGVRMRIDDGQLMIASTNAMRGYDKRSLVESPASDWRPTGDLVRVDGDRVFFEGRISDIINVGGHKVHPLEIERHVRMVPGVADARVYAKASSIAGQLVACEIVVDSAYAPDAVRTAVTRYCAERLSSERRPRFINVVAELAVSETGKTIRSRAR